MIRLNVPESLDAISGSRLQTMLVQEDLIDVLRLRLALRARSSEPAA